MSPFRAVFSGTVWDTFSFVGIFDGISELTIEEVYISCGPQHGFGYPPAAISINHLPDSELIDS